MFGHGGIGDSEGMVAVKRYGTERGLSHPPGTAQHVAAVFETGRPPEAITAALLRVRRPGRRRSMPDLSTDRAGGLPETSSTRHCSRPMKGWTKRAAPGSTQGLVLLLANQVGDLDTLKAALATARDGGSAQIRPRAAV